MLRLRIITLISSMKPLISKYQLLFVVFLIPPPPNKGKTAAVSRERKIPDGVF